MINWVFFPKSDKPPKTAYTVVEAFSKVADKIDSETHTLKSDDVLAAVTPELQMGGFLVETSKKAADKIQVPVLFGINGKLEKSFEADAYNEKAGFVLEVEAGRGVTNNQFLKDLFQACMMHDVDFLGIAIRKKYRDSQDFDRVVRFFETMYASNRIQLPLKGILVIGY